jgi:hypothetical protein
MSRGWDDDAWYDEGDFPPISAEAGRSALVAAAVLSFIMSAFNALASTCFLFCCFMGALVGHANQMQGGFLPQDMVQYVTIGALVFGVCSALAFVLQIVAGLALLRARKWARPLTFALATYAVLVAVALAYLVIAILVKDSVDDDATGMLVLLGISGVFHLGYGVTEFVLLLNPRVYRRLR